MTNNFEISYFEQITIFAKCLIFPHKIYFMNNVYVFCSRLCVCFYC